MVEKNCKSYRILLHLKRLNQYSMRFLSTLFPITFWLLILPSLFFDGELKLIPNVIDLGKLKSGEVKPYYFVIKNSTSNTVAIKNIVGDCGCLNFYWKKRLLRLFLESA